jgi:hypothetical protein
MVPIVKVAKKGGGIGQGLTRGRRHSAQQARGWLEPVDSRGAVSATRTAAGKPCPIPGTGVNAGRNRVDGGLFQGSRPVGLRCQIIDLTSV